VSFRLFARTASCLPVPSTPKSRHHHHRTLLPARINAPSGTSSPCQWALELGCAGRSCRTRCSGMSGAARSTPLQSLRMRAGWTRPGCALRTRCTRAGHHCGWLMRAGVVGLGGRGSCLQWCGNVRGLQLLQLVVLSLSHSLGPPTPSPAHPVVAAQHLDHVAVTVDEHGALLIAAITGLCVAITQPWGG